MLTCLLASTLGMALHADDAPIQRKKDVQELREAERTWLIVGEDTVPNVLPEKNYGRFDRGLFNYLYVPKGKWAIGFTASYGEFRTEDVQILNILKNIDFQGKLFSLKPSFSYFFKHNQSLGIQIDYTRGFANLESLKLDFDEDMNFELKDVKYYQRSYDIGIYYRNYVGLASQSRFAVFNEVSFDLVNGSSRFKRYYNDVLFDTHTRTVGGRINFSPGVCVFLHDFAAFNLSFGVFGLKFTKETQKTNGEDEGSRFSSGLISNSTSSISNLEYWW